MSALATRPNRIIATAPTTTRAVRLVDSIRAMPIEVIRARIEETRAMSDEQVRARHAVENRDRAARAAARLRSL
jgi:hypothetical protein